MLPRNESVYNLRKRFLLAAPNSSAEFYARESFSATDMHECDTFELTAIRCKLVMNEHVDELREGRARHFQGNRKRQARRLRVRFGFASHIKGLQTKCTDSSFSD
jgi:hypothetical protein